MVLYGRTEVLFFEWPQNGDPTTERADLYTLTLQSIDLDLLAGAAMHYVDDQETMTYLLRAAERLRSDKSQGFVLVTSEGVPVNFCWVSDYENFYMFELDYKLKAPSPNSVMFFDCWTPHSARGNGYYGKTIAAVASQLSSAGKLPWIFSVDTNVSSLRGVEKSGFERRFSLIRKRLLFMNRVV